MKVAQFSIGFLWIVWSAVGVSLAQFPGPGPPPWIREPIRFHRAIIRTAPSHNIRFFERGRAVPPQAVRRLHLPVYPVPHFLHTFPPPQAPLPRPLLLPNRVRGTSVHFPPALRPRHAFWFRPEGLRVPVQRARLKHVIGPPVPVRIQFNPVRALSQRPPEAPRVPWSEGWSRWKNARSPRTQFFSSLVSRSPRRAVILPTSPEAPMNTSTGSLGELQDDLGDEAPREAPITEAAEPDVTPSQSSKSSEQLRTKIHANYPSYREEECGPEQSCRSTYQCALVRGRPTFLPCGGAASTFSCCDLSHEGVLDTRRPKKSLVRGDPQCGWNRERTSRIVGSHDTEFGEIPWQAFIQVGEARCGGALLNRQHVITAAHCVNEKTEDEIEVLLGELVLNRAVEELPHVRRAVAKVIVHPGYRDLNLDANDVAILVLDEPVEYQPNIVPICLPEPDESFTGVLASVSGWGRLYANHVVKSSHLQSVQVPVIENTLCRDWLRSRGKFAGIRSDHVCAGYERGGKDACRGDSGGPLTYQKNGRWYLIGLVSAGFSCGKPRQPGIYHRVSSSVEWISSMIST